METRQDLVCCPYQVKNRYTINSQDRMGGSIIRKKYIYDTNINKHVHEPARTDAWTHTCTHILIIMRVNIINHMHTQSGGVHKLFHEMKLLTAQAV